MHLENPTDALIAAAGLFALVIAIWHLRHWREARLLLAALVALCVVRIAEHALRSSGYEGVWLSMLGVLTAASVVLFACGIAHTSRLARRRETRSLQMEDVFTAAGDGIWVLDGGGKTIAINPAAQRMTGYGADEILGQVSHFVIHHSRADGSTYPIEECPIYKSVNFSEPCQVDDEVFWHKDGTPFPVVYSSTPIHDERGTCVGAVQVFRDVTREREERSLLRRARELEGRRRRAFELNDTIVQRLAVADLALAMGRVDEAQVAVRDGLTHAKRIINQWAGEEPDDFVRAEPASSDD